MVRRLKRNGLPYNKGDVQDGQHDEHDQHDE